MSSCSACGHTINCSGGCGFLCTSDCTDCTQWCEPAEVKFDSADAGAASQGGLVRTIKATGERMQLTLNASVANPSANAPRYPSDTPLSLCMQQATLSSLALVLNVMHTATVRAPEGGVDDVVSDEGEYTLEQLAAKHNLIVE